MLGAGVQVENVRSRRSSGECQEQEVKWRMSEVGGQVGGCQEEEVKWRMSKAGFKVEDVW